MMPIAPLMIEHRLIERMIALLKAEHQRISEGAEPDSAFIATAVDFLRTYADRCHHGKEEDVLFRDLGKKALADDLKQIMDGLISDHVSARQTVAKLVAAEERRHAGDHGARQGIAECLDSLVKLYPAHIEKEDKRFFVPAMKYFSAEEQDAMLQAFWELDRKIVHEKYQGIVTRCEESGT